MRVSKTPPERDSLLLVTAVALREIDGRIFIDDQTWLGIAQWLRYFSKVTYAGLEADGVESHSSVTWKPVDEIPGAERLSVVRLPRAFKLWSFARTYRETRSRLRAAIASCERLCFTIGHLVGDWGTVAALEADAQERPYGVWFDRIEHQVIMQAWGSMSWKARMRETLSAPLAKAMNARVVRHSVMGLYQGGDCFEHFRPMAPKPFCVYDTHTTDKDFLPEEQLIAKLAEIRRGAPLRIAYVGRAAEMKGPLDWLSALAAIRDAGVAFAAEWLGDGPLLDEMKSYVKRHGLESSVRLPGFVGDRAEVVEAMRRSHIFMFCHKSPESPRCLIEALVSGSPIVGYDSAYPRDLVGREGGGLMTRLHDWAALARAVIALEQDREKLADLVARAAREGHRFDEDTVYRHRAMLMREHLPALVS